MKLRTAKKIMRSKKHSNRHKLIAVERGVLIMYTSRYNDLLRRAQARLRKYMRHLKPKEQYGYINPTFVPRKAEKPDGYLLGVPFYKGGRPPRHPIPKDVPVHKWEFTYKDHYFWSAPKNQIELK